MAQILKQTNSSQQIYKNEKQSPFVRFVASIRLLEYIAKTPAPYFRLKDASRYTTSNIADIKTYRLQDGVGGATLGTITKIAPNLDDEITSDDFANLSPPAIVTDGTVINLTVVLTNAKSGSLELPFDEEGNPLPNKINGEKQNYQLVVTTTDFGRNVTDDELQSFLSLAYKYQDNLVTNLLSLVELSADDLEPSFYYLAEQKTDEQDNSFLLLVYKHKDALFVQQPNPDINITNLSLTTNSSGMTFSVDTYSAEYGNEINFNHTIENLFRSPINANFVKLQVKLGTDWIDLTQKSIQPENLIFFGSKDETFNVEFLTLSENTVFASICDSFDNSIINDLNLENINYTQIQENFDTEVLNA